MDKFICIKETGSCKLLHLYTVNHDEAFRVKENVFYVIRNNNGDVERIVYKQTFLSCFIPINSFQKENSP